MRKIKNSRKLYLADQDAIFQRDKALENEKRKALIRLKLSQDENHQKHIAEQKEKSRLMNEAREVMFAEVAKLVAKAESLSAAILEKFAMEGGDNLSFDEVKVLMAEFESDIAEIEKAYKVLETESLKDKNNPIATRRKPVEWLYSILLKKSPKFLAVAPVSCLGKAQATNVRKLSDKEKVEILAHLKEIGAFEIENFAKENKSYFDAVATDVDMDKVPVAELYKHLQLDPRRFTQLSKERKKVLFSDLYTDILKKCVDVAPSIMFFMTKEELDYVANVCYKQFAKALLKDPGMLNSVVFYDSFFGKAEHTAKSIFGLMNVEEVKKFVPYFSRYPEIEVVYESKLANAKHKKEEIKDYFRSSEQGI